MYLILAVGAQHQNLRHEVCDLAGREIHNGQHLLADEILRLVMIRDLGRGLFDAQFFAEVHLQLIGRFSGLFKIFRADNGADPDVQFHKIVQLFFEL